MRRGKRWGIALLAALAGLMLAVFLLPAASATFTSQVNAPTSITASATFPGLPKLITDKGPVFYHRMEETQAVAGSAAGTTAADATGSSAGVYGPPIWGPSLWWRFDEAAGATSFSDLSGAVNTASATGTVTAGQAGPMGGAVMLGNGSSLSSLASPFRPDRSFTMSVNVNIGSVVPTTTPLAVVSMTGNSSGTPNGTGTYARSDAMITAEPAASCPVTTAPCWGFAMAGNPQSQAVAFDYARSTTAVAANTWAQLTAVFDQSVSTMYLYVNGSLEGTKAHTVPATAATNVGLDVGRYRDGSWVGTTAGTAQIGETRTWRRVLSAAAITQLAVRPSARYAFNEATGVTPTYTTAANTTGAPGAVARTAGNALANGASLATGREGNAFTIGATAGYLMAPNSLLTTTSSFAVAAWVKLTDNTADHTYFSANNGLGNIVNFGYRQSTNRWVMSVGTLFNGTISIEGDVTPPVLNQWVHLVAVHDDYNNLLRLYVDGTAQTPVAFNYTPSTANGTDVVGGQLNISLLVSSYWQGQVDDLRIYNGYPLNSSATTSTTVQAFVNLINPGLSAEVPGGLQGSTKTGHAGSTAVAFGGTGNGYNNKYSASAATTAFSVECLVRVGTGQSGVIAGFTNPTSPTGLGSTSSDRLLYVDTAGKVRFGVLQSGTPVTVVSAANVDDGAWHHITASVGPITGTGAIAAGGLRLSLDGIVTSNSAVTAATAATGVWRWGGAPFLTANVWPSAPGNPYLTGTIDELAVYDKQLTDQDDLWRVYGNY